jgi:hypothetical protein
VEPVELIDMGDRIVLLADLRVRGQASRVALTGKIATVSAMEHGRIVRVEAYLNHADALQAAGLQG